MKLRLIVLWVCLLWFCAASFGQATQSPNERQRQISRLMAQENYEQAIAESKALIELSSNYLDAYRTLVQASSEAGQLEATRVWLESLLSRSRPLAYVGLALIQQLKDDFAGAVESYHQCLREAPDDDRVATMLAIDYLSLKKGAEAETFFKSLLAERAGSVSGHQGLGVLYAFQGRRAEALAQLDQVIALRPQSALAYSYKGYVLASDGRHSEAVETLQTCLRILQAFPDDRLQLFVFNQLGDAQRRLGNYAEAVKNLENVIELARASGDLRNEETALSQLASVHHRENNYLNALRYWKQAINVSNAIKSRKTQINTYPQRHIAGIGDVYDRLGDVAAAEDAYLEALKLSLEANDRINQSSVLQSLAELYARQGQWHQALSVSQQALTLSEKSANLFNQLGALNNLSALQRQLGHAGKAAEYVLQALKILEERPNPLWEGESWNNLGLLHLSVKEPAKALPAFQKTLAIDPHTMSPRIVWQAHSGLGETYLQLGQLQRAREHYRRAIEIMETVRARLGGGEEKAGFFQDKIQVFKKHITVLLDPRLKGIEAERQAEAFNYAERARARAFLDLLADARVEVDDTIQPDLSKRRQELQKRISQLTAQLISERSRETAKQDQLKIADLDKRLSEADIELGDWLRELRARNPRYAALKYPPPVTLAATQRLLNEETVLLSYSLAEPASFLFAVSRNEFQVKRLPSEQFLRESVEKFLVAITDKENPAPDEYRRQAVYLSRQLLQPVSHMLAGKKALLIIADGALHRLPFEALFLPRVTATQRDFRQLPFLIRRFAISYAPSVSVLAGLQTERRDRAPKELIAFGDPVYELSAEDAIPSTTRAAAAAGRISLQRLPRSRDEIVAIASLFDSDRSELFLGESATEENVKSPERLGRYRLVHFSTHSYVNEARPRFSGLLLSLPQSGTSDPPLEDGLLSAYEIFNLRLRADLVVLSACETGLGKEIKGEGLMSLTRSFIYAGTPSVVVSLWKVNDESAADLMVRFYRHLIKDGMSKREALRQAQLETIKDNGFPFFWAPFILVGNP